LSEILPSSSLDLGPDEVGQKGLKTTPLMTSLIKIRYPKPTIFLLLTRRLVESFEDLNSSLAQSVEELYSCYSMCKLL